MRDGGGGGGRGDRAWRGWEGCGGGGQGARARARRACSTHLGALHAGNVPRARQVEPVGLVELGACVGWDRAARGQWEGCGGRAQRRRVRGRRQGAGICRSPIKKLRSEMSASSRTSVAVSPSLQCALTMPSTRRNMAAGTTCTCVCSVGGRGASGQAKRGRSAGRRQGGGGEPRRRGGKSRQLWVLKQRVVVVAGT